MPPHPPAAASPGEGPLPGEFGLIARHFRPLAAPEALGLLDDAALLAAVTAAMGLFGAAYLRPGAFSAKRAAAFWLVLGASVLLKGPVGPMVPLLAGISLAVADRGAAGAASDNPGLATGFNVVDGKVTYQPVAEATDQEYTPLFDVLESRAAA